MILPDTNIRPQRSTHPGRTFLARLLGIFLAVFLGWSIWVVYQIHFVANHDEAQSADAIAVFGAAEYSGHPSPILHARLDHAVDLYNEKIAPLVVTLGGGRDKDSGNTEGGVGRDYLLANGIPFEDIIAETNSVDTEQQVDRLAEIAREFHFQRIVLVSDGTHLFRIRELCRDAGLTVYTSPRPYLGHISNYDLAQRYFHEIISYTSLRFHLNFSWMHRWLEGRNDT
jgi:uncharacterized SAM-binding protein YcdF (DUF218 family)